MIHRTVTDPTTARTGLERADWLFVDCRFDLAHPDAKQVEHARGHVPGALYAHLERDLSGPIVAGRTGRHPLPDPDAWITTLSRWGLEPTDQVVAYDDAGGAIAARLWWMLRWAGHDAVAVLDGGWPAWLRAGGPTSDGTVRRRPRPFVARFRQALAVDSRALEERIAARRGVLLDARAADRFAGRNETLDPVAGHVPTARSAPFADNLRPDGRFRSRADLRARFEGLAGSTSADEIVVYCGSGVTACHDLLAIAHAGLGDARLYPGSWSEWITDPARPVALGPEPGEPHGVVRAKAGE